MSAIEGPYRHGSRYRCRLRTPEGRRWLPAADTPEEALAQARGVHEHTENAVANPPPLAETTPPVEPDGSPDGVMPSSGVALDADIRLEGPYVHKAKVRYRIATSNGRRWAPAGATQWEALRLAQKKAEALGQQGRVTIRDSIKPYLKSKRAAGVRATTLASIQDALEAFFAGVLNLPIGQVTPHRARQQYERLQARMSVASHRSYLSRVKSWARWVVSKGWIRSSPLEAIQGVGRRRRGKPQLSFDEGNRLGAVCLAEASSGSTATLMCMLMGLRASEAISRVVRDVDRAGAYLRVDDNEEVGFLLKTESSRRPVLIPTPLRPLVTKWTEGKAPSDPLFPGTLSGRKRRQWLYEEVHRLCRKAGVPVICPHSLRGWMASSAVAAGELPEVVARAIGHASAQMTLAHYIAPGIAQEAQLVRGQAAFVETLSSPPT